jgi:3-keto-L-gulonate-6-phosphate decarboxylase
MLAPSQSHVRPWPHIAVDIPPDRGEVLRLACWVGSCADLVELGTLLLKSLDIGIIGEVRAICPQACILVDGKAPDASGREADLIGVTDIRRAVGKCVRWSLSG